jgi:ABC-type spermidine/putrescine transport system permease subunit I
MLILGLLLLAGSAAFTALVIADNLSGGPEYTVSVLGEDIATMNTLAVFCSGLALALIFCLGLALMSAAKTHRRRRKERERHPSDDATIWDGMRGRDAHA